MTVKRAFFALLAFIVATFVMDGAAKAQGDKVKEDENIRIVRGPNPEWTYVRIASDANLHTPSFVAFFHTDMQSLRADNPTETLAVCMKDGHARGAWKGGKPGRASNANWRNCPEENQYVYIVPGETLVLKGVKHLSFGQKQTKLQEIEACDKKKDASCALQALRGLTPNVDWSGVKSSQPSAAPPPPPPPRPLPVLPGEGAPPQQGPSAKRAAPPHVFPPSPARSGTDAPFWFAMVFALTLGALFIFQSVRLGRTRRALAEAREAGNGASEELERQLEEMGERFEVAQQRFLEEQERRVSLKESLETANAEMITLRKNANAVLAGQEVARETAAAERKTQDRTIREFEIGIRSLLGTLPDAGNTSSPDTLEGPSSLIGALREQLSRISGEFQDLCGQALELVTGEGRRTQRALFDTAAPRDLAKALWDVQSNVRNAIESEGLCETDVVPSSLSERVALVLAALREKVGIINRYRKDITRQEVTIVDLQSRLDASYSDEQSSVRLASVHRAQSGNTLIPPANGTSAPPPSPADMRDVGRVSMFHGLATFLGEHRDHVVIPLKHITEVGIVVSLYEMLRQRKFHFAPPEGSAITFSASVTQEEPETWNTLRTCGASVIS